MAKRQAKSTESIERLLEERQKIEEWLQRLSVAADKTPDNVRSRVESDYRKRLDEVVAELQGHRDELASALERHRSDRGGLADQERDATERLAEAELRHAVGEFDEGHFTELRGGIQKSLLEVRGGLENLDSEISRLEEVMELIEAGPAAPDAAATFFDSPDEVDAAIEAVGAEPEPGRGTEAVDELEFLRSVTEDENQGPAASRASGLSLPDDVVSGEVADSGTRPAREDLVVAEEVPNEPKKGAAKTLKCDECGTMNLPTEWYCERCGAELAAL
jgi:hypothetical protein